MPWHLINGIETTLPYDICKDRHAVWNLLFSSNMSFCDQNILFAVNNEMSQVNRELVSSIGRWEMQL